MSVKHAILQDAAGVSVEVPVPDAVQIDSVAEDRVCVLLRLYRYGRLCLVLYSCNRFGCYSFGSDCSRCYYGSEQKIKREEVFIRKCSRFHDEWARSELQAAWLQLDDEELAGVRRRSPADNLIYLLLLFYISFKLYNFIYDKGRFK